MAYPIVSELAKVLGGVIAISIVSACTCSNDITTPREVDPTTTASLRCIVSSPDASEISVMQNDRLLHAKVSRFDTVATYASLPSGIRNIQFIGAQTKTAYLSTNLDLGADRRYTYVTFDSADRMRGVVMFDLVPLATIGMVHVRLVHVADSSGAITLLAHDRTVGLPISFPTAGAYMAVAQGAELSLELENGGDVQRIPIPVDLHTPGRAVTIVVDRNDSGIRTRWFTDR